MLLTTTNILITIGFIFTVVFIIYLLLKNRRLQYKVGKLRYQINYAETSISYNGYRQFNNDVGKYS